MKAEFRLIPRNALRMMLLITGFLLVIHTVLGFGFKYGLGYDSVYGLTGLFDLLGERNVPTFFTALLIFLCSGLLFMISRATRTFRLYWSLLSAVLLFLSIDEIAGFHEALAHIRTEDESDNQQFAWAIPYIIASVIIGIVYLPLLFSLTTRFRVLFMGSGALYVAAAGGLEILAGFFNDAGLSMYVVIAGTFEESLEMVAMSIFAYSLLAYLADRPLGPTVITICN